MKNKHGGVVEGILDCFWVGSYTLAVDIRCGHCGCYSREVGTVMLDPKERAQSLEEQRAFWAEETAYSHRCPKCHVTNVDGEDLATFVAKQRKAEEEGKEWLRRWSESGGAENYPEEDDPDYLPL